MQLSLDVLDFFIKFSFAISCISVSCVGLSLFYIVFCSTKMLLMEKYSHIRRSMKNVFCFCFHADNFPVVWFPPHAPQLLICFDLRWKPFAISVRICIFYTRPGKQYSSGSRQDKIKINNRVSHGNNKQTLTFHTFFNEAKKRCFQCFSNSFKIMFILYPFWST